MGNLKQDRGAKKPEQTASPPTCYCGSSSHLDSNAKIYNGKVYGNGKIWLCDRFPDCRGSVGTHPDGRPLGTICDPETKKLRMQVHDLIDPIWQNDTTRSKKKARGSVYGWMKRITGMETYHTGSLTKEECLVALKAIAENPYEDRRTAVNDLRLDDSQSQVEDTNTSQSDPITKEEGSGK